MSTKNTITKELSDTIKHVLDRNAKISFKCLVRMEVKPEKTENRVLAFSSCRFFILSAKVPTKIESTFHYLEIQAIESKKSNQLCLHIDSKVYTFYSMDTDSKDVDHMIVQLGTAIKSIFPQVPLELIIRKIDVTPSDRLQPMLEFNQSTEASDPGPCGNFSTQYACMCDFHGLPYRDDVAWDVDTIYLSHDSKELSLLDFDHLEGRDLVPIISALCYNAWFTKFRASNTKLASEALEQILQVMKRSVSIEELCLDNTGIKCDFVYKLSVALITNPNTPLNSLDLSNNLIEDKGLNSLCGIIAKITQGVGQLCGPIGKLHKGLTYLNLAHTGITAKGVNTLAHALSLNRAMPSNLTYLNLSDNVFKDDINNLYNYLAQPNSLVHLDLSGTDCALETVFGALLRGCTQKLERLNLSRNLFSTKKAKDVNVPPSFKAFFSSTVALKWLNMSCVRMPTEALKAMLLGLACNEIATDVFLDLSNNDLKAQGATVLESCLPEIRCLNGLDISENNFDQDLANIVIAVSKNQSLKKLSLGRNFANMKTKHITRIMEAVVQLIQEKDSVLEYISLADSKLRGELCLVINALGSNQCLTSIDISGNYTGVTGAKTLAKALQINSKLRSLLWDRNCTPPQGFQDIAYALEKNFTLKYMPCPVVDVTAAMKIAPEKTEAAIKKITELLNRNVSPKKYCNGQAFRLQQGFLLSSTQQMVDRWMSHLHDVIKTAQSSSQEDLTYVEEVKKAEGYLKDANSAKQLLTQLHEVVMQQDETGNPIELKLQHCVEEMRKTLDVYLKGTASNMLKCVEDQCPTIMSDEKVRREIEELCNDKSSFPLDVLQHSLLEQAGADILNRVSEINLMKAAHISDRIVDEVIESLPRSHRDLATPKLPNKRKSMNSRKMRPQSVVDSIEGIAADDIPDLLPKDSEDSLPNLSPTSEKLEHLGKARPKRPKAHAPTRPCIQSSDAKEEIQNLAEGLDTFFTRHPSSSTPTLSPDSEEIRFRSDSSSTSVSSSVLIMQTPPLVEAKSDKEIDKKGFIKGMVSSLLTRVSTSESVSIQKMQESGERIHRISVESNSSEDLVKKENGDITVKRLTHPVEPTVEKFGFSSGIMAEMKALQEKRTALLHSKETLFEEKSSCHESKEVSSMFSSVKLKATGLAESLRSVTEFPKDRTSAADSSQEELSESGIFSSSSRLAALLKGKPPPPVAPKPRPRSVVGGVESIRLSGDFSGEDSPLTKAQSLEETLETSGCMRTKVMESTCRIQSSVFKETKESSRSCQECVSSSSSSPQTSKRSLDCLPSADPKDKTEPESNNTSSSDDIVNV